MFCSSSSFRSRLITCSSGTTIGTRSSSGDTRPRQTANDRRALLAPRRLSFYGTSWEAVAIALQMHDFRVSVINRLLFATAPQTNRLQVPVFLDTRAHGLPEHEQNSVVFNQI